MPPRKRAPRSPRSRLVPWMAVFGETSFYVVIVDFLRGQLCDPECYVCKEEEVVLIQDLGGSFLRCCTVLAGRDEAGGCCHWCGCSCNQKVIFHRFQSSKAVYYSLLEELHRLRIIMVEKAREKVAVAEEQNGQLPDPVAQRVYAMHLHRLQLRCNSRHDHSLESDDSVDMESIDSAAHDLFFGGISD